MFILDATIRNVRRARDFGRVEAVVTLLIKEAGRPARPVSIRTNVPDRGPRPLRQRLLSDAAALIRHRVGTRPATPARAA